MSSAKAPAEEQRWWVKMNNYSILSFLSHERKGVLEQLCFFRAQKVYHCETLHCCASLTVYLYNIYCS